MQALGYAERAACLVSGDSYAHAKPHPEPLLTSLRAYRRRRCGVPVSGRRFTAYMQAANSAGMRGIIANYGYVSHDASIENWHAYGSVNTPAELLAYLTL